MLVFRGSSLEYVHRAKWVSVREFGSLRNDGNFHKWEATLLSGI